MASVKQVLPAKARRTKTIASRPTPACPQQDAMLHRSPPVNCFSAYIQRHPDDLAGVCADGLRPAPRTTTPAPAQDCREED